MSTARRAVDKDEKAHVLKSTTAVIPFSSIMMVIGVKPGSLLRELHAGIGFLWNAIDTVRVLSTTLVSETESDGLGRAVNLVKKRTVTLMTSLRLQLILNKVP